MWSSKRRGQPLRIGILGTRGIPACYGGFETFAEELSTRLFDRGHQVTVYGRSGFVDSNLSEYKGVGIRVLPSVGHKYLETVSHTAVSVVSALTEPFDVLLVCNAANAFLCWIPFLAGQKVVLNLDGIERLRKKWNLLGRLFYRLGEFLATQLPDVCVADAACIRNYYLEEYGFESRLIAYGAPAESIGTTGALDELHLSSGQYLLYVSRLEPENNAHRVIAAYRESKLSVPLVLVGDAPYSDRYIKELRRMAEGLNVVMAGAIYGDPYRELLSHCSCFIQATEVGGTHPALIEAMGAGCIVLANDTPENREVVRDCGLLYPFNDERELGRLMRKVYSELEKYRVLGEMAQERVRVHYNWEKVVDSYEELFYDVLGAPTA